MQDSPFWIPAPILKSISMSKVLRSCSNWSWVGVVAHDRKRKSWVGKRFTDFPFGFLKIRFTDKAETNSTLSVYSRQIQSGQTPKLRYHSSGILYWFLRFFHTHATIHHRSNSYLSLLAMADCWAHLGINPYVHLDLALHPYIDFSWA